MCMEDIRIGNSRFTRLTQVASGAVVQFKGDSRRVLIRMITPGGSTAARTGIYLNGTSAGFAGDAQNPLIMYVSNTAPVDELTLEKHGNVVKLGFTVDQTNNGGVISIMEVLLDDQKNPPPVNQVQ